MESKFKRYVEARADNLTNLHQLVTTNSLREVWKQSPDIGLELVCQGLRQMWQRGCVALAALGKRFDRLEGGFRIVDKSLRCRGAFEVRRVLRHEVVM